MRLLKRPATRAALLALSALVATPCLPMLTAQAQARPAPDSFADLAAKLLPGVVNVSSSTLLQARNPAQGPEIPQFPPGSPFEQFFKDFMDRNHQGGGGQAPAPRRAQSLGSGFIIDPSGIIVTNNHVVDHADKIVVSLTDGRQLPATVLGRDELTDVAVIKVQTAEALPSVTWGDSRKAEVGDWIMAAGNPFGLGGSVSVGIISAEGRDLGSGPFDNFLQLDAPINPGNSGGPVFNMDGQVIGVSSVIVSPTGASVGIGFAIPSEAVSRTVAQLLSRGSIERGWLGVSVEDRDGGVTIANIDRSGPAAKAGIKAGDVVIAVNGDKIDSSRGLIRAVAVVPPGNSVRVTLRRQGREMDISVSVGRRPTEQQAG